MDRRTRSQICCNLMKRVHVTKRTVANGKLMSLRTLRSVTFFAAKSLKNWLPDETCTRRPATERLKLSLRNKAPLRPAPCCLHPSWLRRKGLPRAKTEQETLRPLRLRRCSQSLPSFARFVLPLWLLRRISSRMDGVNISLLMMWPCGRITLAVFSFARGRC